MLFQKEIDKLKSFKEKIDDLKSIYDKISGDVPEFLKALEGIKSVDDLKSRQKSINDMIIKLNIEQKQISEILK